MQRFYPIAPFRLHTVYIRIFSESGTAEISRFCLLLNHFIIPHIVKTAAHYGILPVSCNHKHGTSVSNLGAISTYCLTSALPCFPARLFIFTQEFLKPAHALGQRHLVGKQIQG